MQSIFGELKMDRFKGKQFQKDVIILSQSAIIFDII